MYTRMTGHLVKFTGEVLGSQRDCEHFIRSRAEAFSYSEIGGPFVVHHHAQPTSNVFFGLNLISVKTYRDVAIKSSNLCGLF